MSRGSMFDRSGVTRAFSAFAVTAGLAATSLTTLPAQAEPITIPSGVYELDLGHASIVWKIDHLGLSNYTARFNDFDATLNFDVENPANSSVTVTIDPTSVDTDYPYADQKDFNAALVNQENFFNASVFPDITFQSTGIEVTGDRTGKITGDLTLLGITRPVTLDVTMNGFLEEHPFAGGIPAVGFSGTTTITRSDWGMDWGIGNIGDEVEILIEAEFVKAQ